MKYFSMVLLSVFLLVGCASYKPPVKTKIQNTYTINKSYNNAWDGIVDFFSESGVFVDQIDKTSGFMASEMALLKSGVESEELGEYTDCGDYTAEFGYSTDYDVYIKFNVQVLGDETSSTIKINCFFKTIVIETYLNYTRKKTLKCYSTGLFEQELIAYLQ